MGDVTKSFVEPMMERFAIDAPSKDALLGDLIEELGDFSDAVLERAVVEFRRKRQYRTFPSVAECLKVCGAAAEAEAALHPRPQPAWTASKDWTQTAMERADQMIQGPMGVRAADEGWALGLWNFCRREGRLPRPVEVADIKAAHAAFVACVRDLEGGRGAGEATSALLQLAQTMIERGAQKAQLARGNCG